MPDDSVTLNSLVDQVDRLERTVEALCRYLRVSVDVTGSIDGFPTVLLVELADQTLRDQYLEAAVKCQQMADLDMPNSQLGYAEQCQRLWGRMNDATKSGLSPTPEELP